MNPPPPRLLRAAVASLLWTIMMVLGVAVPMLDSPGGERGAVLETEHHATCVTGHDHTICTQVGSNLLGASQAAVVRLPAAAIVTEASGPAEGTVPHLRTRRHPPRAPPTV